MAELKTRKSEASVEEFINAISDEQRRDECREIAQMMREATGVEPKMWGASIVGFGDCHYRYASGREGDWFQLGFAPRKGNLTLYLSSEFTSHRELLDRLGSHSTGKSCLYIKRLDDIHRPTLQKLLQQSLQDLKSCG